MLAGLWLLVIPGGIIYLIGTSNAEEVPLSSSFMMLGHTVSLLASHFVTSLCWALRSISKCTILPHLVELSERICFIPGSCLVGIFRFRSIMLRNNGCHPSFVQTQYACLARDVEAVVACRLLKPNGKLCLSGLTYGKGPLGFVASGRLLVPAPCAC